jgi:hypothetical protein
MKSRRTGIFFNDSLERRLNHGLADIDAYYTDSDRIYMISNKGLFEVNGINVRHLHDSVKTSFDSITSFTDSNVFLRDDFDRILFAVPEDIVMVWSRKHDLWTTYDDKSAYRGMFKNADNEYIAFGKIPGDVHFFVDFDTSTQDPNTTPIVISYESPLLKLDNLEGIHSELTQLYYRHQSTTTGTFTLKIYDWRRNSKATALTLTLENPTTISTVVKHLTDIWGEAFSIELGGSGTVFQFSGLTLYYEPAGIAEEMHT